jgi:hypothetical protein
MKTMDLLRQKLSDESIINQELVAGIDAKAIRSRRQTIVSRYTKAGSDLNRLCLKAQVSIPSSIKQAASQYASEIQELVAEKIRFFMNNPEPVTDEDFLCKEISWDFEQIAMCICYEVEDEYLNGLWVSYRAGIVPSIGFPVPGTFAEAMTISRDAALLMVQNADKEVQEQERLLAEEKERFDREMAESGNRPTESILKRLGKTFGFSTPETRFLFTEGDISSVPLPQVWRELLAAQWAGQPIPWDRLWTKEAFSLFPILEPSLKNHCQGLCVVTQPKSPPRLAYLFAYKSDYFPGGKGFAVYLGGSPVLPDDLPTDIRRKFDFLPRDLQEFYTTVHDGWCDWAGWGGPRPSSRLQFLGEVVTDNDVFRGKLKNKPFSLNDLLKVVGNGSGDCVCLDTLHSTPDKPVGIYYLHETPRKSKVGIDFWKAINEQFDREMEGSISNG